MPPMIRVKATATFDAALEGIEIVKFKKGEIHPTALDAEHIKAWLADKRLVDVTASLAKEEAAQKALLAKQAAEKAEAQRKAAEEEAKRKEEEAAKAADEAKKAGDGGEGQGSEESTEEEILTPEQLKALNKETLIKRAQTEGAKFEENWNKGQIVEAIIAARSAK